ncbi:MAG: adenylate/guanylate cyclase domain-containing protein [Actinomycetota bacterium]|nr:adenylate/guanylate cyclase domain-containing protein [Actinomycetota bacterium]
MELPEVYYARSGDVAIAYQVVGDGPVDIVFARGFAGELVSTWEQPLLVRQIEGFASFARVLMLDKRGTGLSDRVRDLPTLETRMDDLRAVLDDVGSEEAVLWTGQEGARLVTLFAATYPERTAGLAMHDPSARGSPTPDYPWAESDEEYRRRMAEIRTGWGTRAFLEDPLREWVPNKVDDEAFRNWFVWHMRRSLSPGGALGLYRMMRDADVSDVLSAVRVPTILFHNSGDPGPSGYIAERVQNAEVIELPGSTRAYGWVDDEAHEVIIREVRRFVSELSLTPRAERVLATVLFTDIVGSTEMASAMGDRAWREILDRFHALIRREVARFRGREIDTAGDGFLASFDGPARAIGCAAAARDALRDVEVDVRAGVHTGECEVQGSKLAGIAVHIGARIMSLAGPGEVLVSQTVKDLVSGSGIAFEHRGSHSLKGVPEEWTLFAVAGSPS